jgi:nicotinamide-nucleotide amidase
VITIGDELLIGQTIDTNSAFIGQELNNIGIWVRRRVAVGDNYSEIWAALDEESKNSRVIIITGGLGPTADDITKPLLADYFNGKLVVDEKVREHVRYLIQEVFKRKGPVLERNLKQAEVPDTCTVIFNERGTAPGMMFKKNGVIYFSLPGVPHEMKGLMKKIIPILEKEFEELPVIIHKTAFTAGQGESIIAEMLKEFEPSLPPNIKLAYLPNYGMVKLRLTATGTNREETEKLLKPWFSQLQQIVKEYLVSNEDEGLELVVGKLLKQKNATMATAESCTGGYIAHLITSIPGSSDYFKGSIVSIFGAVSQQTVSEMVKGTISKLKVDYALAVSGIMGPEGGTATKPVGTVWIAVGNKNKTETLHLHLRFDRQRNIVTTSGNALNFLRKFILDN